ncbi:FAD-dependent monooxygenase [Pseudonocardia nigra]|uniref:FAD-dependent monooxygenase n=1 Tax=Pseudonocardia nigra TaxID=1921578 RepID=UPI001C5F637A|nr:FAD-dependent monooxygenase [Pseudonocardia nigra]
MSSNQDDVRSRPAAANRLPGTTQVLIAGGGPVGLAAAVELGRRGVECVVVEPRTTVSRARPRCKTVNVRTMEHLRRWGIADRLRASAPLPVSWSSDIVFCTSLAGRELSRFTGVLGLEIGDRSPEPGQQCPQYVLEELLRDVVDELDPCTLVTGSSVVGIDQDAERVRVAVQDPDGRRNVITADYVLGCDGPHSTVREQIGSEYVGQHALRPNFGMVFHAPGLWNHVRHGRAVQYWTVNPDAPALIGPIDRTGTWWLIAFGVDRQTGERQARQLIDAAAGLPVDATVLSTDPWTARMQLVDRARHGRVFLAGDAAHLNPPFGGHGLNTGIGDAVDLGWKLAAVLHGWGGPALLDSYEAERRPVQDRVIREAEQNMRTPSMELLTDDLDRDDAAGERARRAAHLRIQETKAAEFHALDLVLDTVHRDSPVIVSSAPARVGEDADPARPGARLPHRWLSAGRSLHDVLGPGLTLLVLADRAGPVDALTDAARSRGVPLTAVDLRAAALSPRLGAALTLVRPDQHVAWCGDQLPADPAGLLDAVCGFARGRFPQPTPPVPRYAP